MCMHCLYLFKKEEEEEVMATFVSMLRRRIKKVGDTFFSTLLLHPMNVKKQITLSLHTKWLMNYGSIPTTQGC